MTYMYDMPDEIQVEADGPLRIITLNRPASLNAVNDVLHTGLARLWPRLSEDHEARCAVLTGAGRAFSAGGDLTSFGTDDFRTTITQLTEKLTEEKK
jgi:enoyl-CoA hydratase